MRSVPILFLLLLAALPSCRSPSRSAPAAALPPDANAPAAETPTAPPAEPRRERKSRPGVFVPATYVAISIWPEAYSGELVVTEVVPHGAHIEQNDVIARLETRAIDEQVHQAELEARSAAVRHAGVVEKGVIEEEAAAAALEQSRTSAERARRQLDGWTQYEVPFARRGDEINKQYEDAGIEDQKDELTQLEKMYGADELVDATEEIVLKRAKRRLAISQTSQVLSGDRRGYRVEYDEAMQSQQKGEAARMQAGTLDRLGRTQTIERRARADAEARSADALDQQLKKLEKLRRDREMFTVRAPKPGVLLHGKEKDYRPGKTPARWERGSQLTSRSDLFLVADPGSVGVAVEVPESMLKEATEGIQVTVATVMDPEKTVSGVLHLEAMPSAKSGPAEECSFDGSVTLEQPVEGVVFGMRAKVSLPESPSGEAGAATAAAAGPGGARQAE